MGIIIKTKEVDMIEHSKESLENLRIHELRDLARKVGVKAPTLLKKEDIIEQTMAIISGDQKPYVKKNNKGRPAKNSLSESEMFIPSFNQEQGDKNDLVLENQKFGFFINAPGLRFNLSNDATETEGILDIHPNGYGILRTQGYSPSDNDIFVCTQTVAENNLRIGQKISGLEREIQKGKPHAVVKLTGIEGIDPSRYILQPAFDQLPYVEQKRALPVTNILKKSVKITEGSRSFISFKDVKTMTICGIDLCKNIAKDSSHIVVYLNMDALPEDTAQYGNFEKIDIPFSMSEVNQISTINLAIERAKRRVENGENVIVIIKEMSKLLRILNTSITDMVSYENLNIKALHKMKKIIMTAKGGKAGSLTVIMLDSDGSAPKSIQDVITFELMPLFNNIIKID